MHATASTMCLTYATICLAAIVPYAEMLYGHRATSGCNWKGKVMFQLNLQLPTPHGKHNSQASCLQAALTSITAEKR